MPKTGIEPGTIKIFSLTHSLEGWGKPDSLIEGGKGKKLEENSGRKSARADKKEKKKKKKTASK